MLLQSFFEQSQTELVLRVHLQELFRKRKLAFDSYP